MAVAPVPCWQLLRRMLPKPMSLLLDLGVPRRLGFSNSGTVGRLLCTTSSRKQRPDGPQNWILCKVQNSQHFPLRREHTINWQESDPSHGQGRRASKSPFPAPRSFRRQRTLLYSLDVSGQMQMLVPWKGHLWTNVN